MKTVAEVVKISMLRIEDEMFGGPAAGQLASDKILVAAGDISGFLGSPTK